MIVCVHHRQFGAAGTGELQGAGGGGGSMHGVQISKAMEVRS